MTTKVCYACEKELPLDRFRLNRSKGDGVSSECKDCSAEISRKYRIEKADAIRMKRHDYYLRNKEVITKKVGEYIKNNRVKVRAWNKVARDKLKDEVFTHYCNGTIKCHHCNETDLGVLTLDHVDGGGNKHRKESGMKTGYNACCWLKKHGYPEGFQVLCWNCQFKKRLAQMQPEAPDKRQLQKSAYRKLVKQQCLDEYGKTCKCGVSDQDVLTLDHVNDDGKQHREDTKARGLNFYIHLRKNGFPNDPPLQVMCMKCQYRKRNNDNEKSVAQT